MINEIQLSYVLLGATALLAAAASLSIVRFQKKVRDSAAFWNSPTGAAVQAAAPAPPAQDADLAAQIGELRQVIEALVAREKEPAATPFTESRVSNAVLLAKQGANVRDLVQACGLNAGEAQLLLRLHAPRTKLTDAA